MSTGVYVQDAPEAVSQIEEQIIVERASVEPETLDETASLLGHSKRQFPNRVILMLAVLTLFTVSAVSTMPAGLDITYRFVCYFLDVEQDKCLTNDRAGERVANFTSVGSIVRGIFGLVVSSYLSAMSDRMGRKPFFVCAFLLTALSHITSWYIVFHLPNPSTYWWLLVPTFVDGLGGGVGLISILSGAYISDMVPDATQRTKLLAMVDGCFFGSLALGPTFGSWVIRMWGIEVLFIITSIGALLASLLTLIFMGESLSPYHKRRNSTNKRSVSSTLSMLTFKHISDPKSRRNAWILLICALLGSEFAMSFVVVLLLYPKRVFGWTAVQSGYLVSAMSSTRTFWFLVGFPYLYSRLSNHYEVHKDRIDKVDTTLLRACLGFSVLGYFSMAYAGNQEQFFIGGVIDACSSIGLPIYKASLIKYVPQGQFGSFFAVFNFICAASAIVFPTVFLKIYSHTFSWRPYFTFEIVGSIFVIIFFITFLLKPN